MPTPLENIMESKAQIDQVSVLGDQLANFRKRINQDVFPAKPLAYSVDGRTFDYEIPFVQAFPVGAYVSIQVAAGTEYLGQVSVQAPATREGPSYGLQLTANSQPVLANSTSTSHLLDRTTIKYVHGSGQILGELSGSKLEAITDRAPFADATIRLASTEVIAGYLSGGDNNKQKTDSDIGYATRAEKGKARVYLRTEGFRRHTFICGQSRSGKTYALGVVLERLLLSDSETRIVIIDPNSDFVRLNKLNRGPSSGHLDVDERKRMRERFRRLAPKIHISRPYTTDPYSLNIRLSDLGHWEQEAILQLDPIRNLDEFSVFSGIFKKLKKQRYIWKDINEAVASAPGAPLPKHNFTLRIQNLGVANWGIWSRTASETSLADLLKADDWRCMVIDVGSLELPEEKAATTLALLSQLWNAKDRERPLLLVIDEAHNICPYQPSNRMEEIATDNVIRIAGEGLKYGLRLLLVSQRPAKIHPSVLTQCENLVLMRMVSRTDLEKLTHEFSQVPSGLMQQSIYFEQGESLLAGEIVPSPTLARFEGRITTEGGGDRATRV